MPDARNRIEEKFKLMRDSQSKIKGVATNNPNEKVNKRNGSSNVFFAFHYNHKANVFQCKNCSSDYGRGAVNGFCQDCQQRAEYILREHPQTVARVQPQGGANAK